MSNVNITRSIVAEDKRLNFLPAYVGKEFIKFEMTVYNYMGFFCKEYKGGYWTYYTLCNGGFYMGLKTDEGFNVVNEMNYFNERMSADAASIGVCLFSINSLLQSKQEDKLIDAYYHLLDFSSDHIESNKIYGFID